MPRRSWRRIDEYPNYDISSMGDVRNRRTGKILKNYDDGAGYLRVKLCGDNVRVHLLVAKYFVSNDNPDVKTVVNHKKGKKNDPRPSQLEWVTQSENIKHAWDHGLIKRRRKKNVKSMDGC